MTRVFSKLLGGRSGTSNHHRRSASVVSFNHDGLEIARVRQPSRVRWLPLWHIIFFVYLGLLIRLVVMADLGPASYANRMAQLENGTWIERATARVMYMDPVSRKIAASLRSGIKTVGNL